MNMSIKEYIDNMKNNGFDGVALINPDQSEIYDMYLDANIPLYAGMMVDNRAGICEKSTVIGGKFHDYYLFAHNGGL